MTNHQLMILFKIKLLQTATYTKLIMSVLHTLRIKDSDCL